MAALMGLGCGGGIRASKLSHVAPPKNLSSLQLGSSWRTCASSSSPSSSSYVAIAAGGPSSSTCIVCEFYMDRYRWLCFAWLGDIKLLRLRWVWVQRVRRWWPLSKWVRRKWRRGNGCSTALPLCTTRSDSSLKPKISLAVRYVCVYIYTYVLSESRQKHVSYQSLCMSHLSLNDVVDLTILLSLLYAPKPMKPSKPWSNAVPFAIAGFLQATKNGQLSIMHDSWMIWPCQTISLPQWEFKEVLLKFGLISSSWDDHLPLNLGYWANPSASLPLSYGGIKEVV